MVFIVTLLKPLMDAYEVLAGLPTAVVALVRVKEE